MDAEQDGLANPFNMDEECQNCPNLVACREAVVHGYGDVGAEFAVVGTAPGPGAEETGVPFTGDEAGRRLQRVLGELGFSRSPPDASEPDLQNVFLTALTRCRSPDREPTDEEIRRCDPYLTAELRMINPEIIVAVGDRPLSALAVEYTTRSPESFDARAEHATTVRGRGFEIVPTIPPGEATDAELDALADHLAENVLSRDYRQTKGRRSR